MKKTFKILGLIILIIALVAFGFYLYLTDFCRKGILSNEPRKPKIEIPITYNIGWWANQDKLIIENLDIQIIQSELNLFNSKSLVRYKINGKIKTPYDWKTHIKEVHISDRFNKDSTLNFDRIIELTPIVGIKDDEKTNGKNANFEFTNELIITSANMGVNRIKFICADKEQIIELVQTK